VNLKTGSLGTNFAISRLLIAKRMTTELRIDWFWEDAATPPFVAALEDALVGGHSS
jgi:hypothetical protein